MTNSIRHRAVRIASGFALLLCACDPSKPVFDLGPVPNVAFTTDASGYTARVVPNTGTLRMYQFTIISKFQNRSTAPLYLARCFPDSPQPNYGVGVASASPVESAYDGIWACVGHNAQFEILPGASRVDTLQVRGPSTFKGSVGLGVTEGMFKLYYDVRLARGDGATRAPDDVQVSNAFIVHASN